MKFVTLYNLLSPIYINWGSVEIIPYSQGTDGGKIRPLIEICLNPLPVTSYRIKVVPERYLLQRLCLHT